MDINGLQANTTYYVALLSFDGRGNYSMGIADQTIFAEIDLAKVTYTHGMNVTFVTTAATDAHARELLTRLGVPFRKADLQD